MKTGLKSAESRGCHCHRSIHGLSFLGFDDDALHIHVKVFQPFFLKIPEDVWSSHKYVREAFTTSELINWSYGGLQLFNLPPALLQTLDRYPHIYRYLPTHSHHGLHVNLEWRPTQSATPPPAPRPTSRDVNLYYSSAESALSSRIRTIHRLVDYHRTRRSTLRCQSETSPTPKRTIRWSVPQLISQAASVSVPPAPASNLRLHQRQPVEVRQVSSANLVSHPFGINSCKVDMAEMPENCHRGEALGGMQRRSALRLLARSSCPAVSRRPQPNMPRIPETAGRDISNPARSRPSQAQSSPALRTVLLA